MAMFESNDPLVHPALFACLGFAGNLVLASMRLNRKFQAPGKREEQHPRACSIPTMFHPQNSRDVAPPMVLHKTHAHTSPTRALEGTRRKAPILALCMGWNRPCTRRLGPLGHSRSWERS